MRINASNQYFLQNSNPGFKMNLVSVPEENQSMFNSLKKAVFRVSPNKDAYLKREVISNVWYYVLRCHGKIAKNLGPMSDKKIIYMAKHMKREAQV